MKHCGNTTYISRPKLDSGRKDRGKKGPKILRGHGKKNLFSLLMTPMRINEINELEKGTVLIRTLVGTQGEFRGWQVRLR